MFLEVRNVTNGVIYSDTFLRSVRLKSYNRQSRIFFLGRGNASRR